MAGGTLVSVIDPTQPSELLSLDDGSSLSQPAINKLLSVMELYTAATGNFDPTPSLLAQSSAGRAVLQAESLYWTPPASGPALTGIVSPGSTYAATASNQSFIVSGTAAVNWPPAGMPGSIAVPTGEPSILINTGTYQAEAIGIDPTVAGPVFINGGTAFTRLGAGTGNDVLVSTATNAVLIGGSGTDTLWAMGNNATLVGGSGADFLAGGTAAANPTFIAGSGAETIVAYDANTAATVSFASAAGGVTVNLAASTGILASGTIDSITGVGTVIGAAGFNNVLTAGGSGGKLVGGSANDVLTSGSGNDMLIGGGGNDSYVLSPGAGQDVIVNGVPSTGAANTPSGALVLGGTIGLNQLWITQSGTNLAVQVLGTATSAAVQGWYANPYAQLLDIVQANGTSLNTSEIGTLATFDGAYQAAVPGFNPLTGNVSVSVAAGSSVAVSSVANAIGVALDNGTLTAAGANDWLAVLGNNATAIAGSGGTIYVGGTGDLVQAPVAAITATTGATFVVADGSSDILSHLGALQAFGGKLTGIVLTDGATPTLSVTAAQLSTYANVFGLISSAYNLSVSGVSAANAAAIAGQAHVVALSVSDTAVAVAANLDSLTALGTTLSNIVLTDGSTPTLSITAYQLTADAGALAAIVGPYNLKVSGVSAANAVSISQMPHVTAISLSDFAFYVAANLTALLSLGSELTGVSVTGASAPSFVTTLDSLQALGSKLTAITLLPVATTLSITATQLTADAGALGKIVNAFYNLRVAGVTAANAASTAGQAHVSGVAISDSAANVVANLAALQALGSTLTGIALTDANTPTLAITAAQLSADAGALGTITSAYNLSVSGVLAANAVSTAGQANVVAVTVSDSVANVVANLAALQALGSALTGILLTDTGTPTLALTVAQLTNDEGALGKIASAFNLSLPTGASNLTIGVNGSGDTVATNGNTGDTVNIVGNNDTVSLGSGSTAQLSGTNETVNASNDSVVLGAASSATVNGSADTIALFGSDTVTAAGDIISIGTNNLTVTVYGGGDLISSNGNTGDTVNLTGNNDGIYLGSGGTAQISGTGETFNGSNDSIVLQSASANVTVLGNLDSIVANLGSDTVTVSGTGEVANFLNGGTLNENSATTSATLFGNGVTAWMNGGGGTLVAMGNGDVVTGGGGTTVITLNGTNDIAGVWAGDTIYVNGLNAATYSSNDTIVLAGSSSATVYGSADQITFLGSDTVTASSDTIAIGANNLTVAINGSGNTIAANGFTGDTVNVTGSNNTFVLGVNGSLSLVAGTSTIRFVAGSQDTVTAVANTGSQSVSGFNMANGDRIDLSQFLSTASLTHNLSNLSSFVSVSTSGSNTVLQIAGAAGSDTVQLNGVGALSLQTLINGNAFILPPH